MEEKSTTQQQKAGKRKNQVLTTGTSEPVNGTLEPNATAWDFSSVTSDINSSLLWSVLCHLLITPMGRCFNITAHRNASVTWTAKLLNSSTDTHLFFISLLDSFSFQLSWLLLLYNYTFYPHRHTSDRFQCNDCKKEKKDQFHNSFHRKLNDFLCHLHH